MILDFFGGFGNRPGKVMRQPIQFSPVRSSRLWRSWASAWNRLTAHPLDTDHDKYDMTLDANLRRMQS